MLSQYLRSSPSSQEARAQRKKQYLCRMLEQQIERNEALEADNYKLEEEQRKLLELLQLRTKQLKQIKRNSTSIIKGRPGVGKMGDEAKGHALIQPYDANKPADDLVKPDGNEETKIEGNESREQQQAERVHQQLMVSLRQKEEQLQRMRQKYNQFIDELQKQLEESRKANSMAAKQKQECIDEIEEYRQVISKQLARISQLVTLLEGSELQKQQHLTMLQKMRQRQQIDRKTQKLLQQDQEEEFYVRKFESLQAKIMEKQEEHAAQICAIQEAHTQQLKRLQLQFEGRLQNMSKKYKDQLEIESEVVRQKQQTLHQVNEETNCLKIRLKDTMERYQSQCEIVMAIENSKQNLQDKYDLMAEELDNYRSALEASSRQSVNIDNVHKQYQSQLNEKDETIRDKMTEIEYCHKENKLTAEELAKCKAKYDDYLRKTSQKILSIQSQVLQLKEANQIKSEQIQFLRKELNLKNEENKRLSSKVDKQSQKKQQYIAKLEETVKKLTLQLQEEQQAFNQKEQDIMDYKQKMDLLVQELKQQNKEIKAQIAGLQAELNSKSNQLIQMEVKNKNASLNLQKQNQTLSIKFSNVCSRLSQVQSEKQNYKGLYEDSTQQLNQMKQQVIKLMNINERMQQKIEDYQKEIQYLKEQILANNLSESEKTQLQNLRRQALQNKARLSKSNQNGKKMKESLDQLTREKQLAEQEIGTCKSQIHRLSSELQRCKEISLAQEQKIGKLQEELKLRSERLEKEIPYLNQVLEQKKNNDLEIQRLKNQREKLVNQINLTKKSKAQEIVGLMQKIKSEQKRSAELEAEMQEHREIIERFNREKVSMLRENTTREDLIKKYERENRQLKQDLKQSQRNVQKLMQYVQIADGAMQNVQIYDSFSHRKQR